MVNLSGNQTIKQFSIEMVGLNEKINHKWWIVDCLVRKKPCSFFHKKGLLRSCHLRSQLGPAIAGSGAFDTAVYIGAQGQQQLGDTAGVMEMDEMDQEMDEMGQILTRKPSEKHQKNHRFCMFW